MKCRIAKEEICHAISKVRGKVGLYVRNLDTAEELFIDENETMVACSVIKIPICVMFL